MSFRVIIGDRRDITRHAGGLSYSNVDPGGHETFTAQIPVAHLPDPGEQLDVWDGLTRVWHGLVEEPAETINGRHAVGRLSGVGAGARLKDNPFTVTFVHARPRDYQDPRSLDTAPLTNFRTNGAVQAGDAPTIGFPSGADVTAGDAAGITLDLGALAAAKRVVITFENNGVATGTYSLYVKGNDLPSQIISGGDNAIGPIDPSSASTTQAGTFTTPRRFVTILLYKGTGGTTSETADRLVRITSIKVFGDTPYESGNASIITPSSAALVALANSGAPVAPGFIERNSYVVQHLMYGDKPVDADAILTDLGKLAAWHWGVWEPAWGDPRARLDFHAPPRQATALVRRRDCTGLEVAEKRSGLYDSILVTFADAAGHPGSTVVTLPNPRMPARQSRRMTADMGIGDVSTAALYGQAVLGLQQIGNRGAGSPTLPRSVMLPGGGLRPAHHLQAGRDRLGIVDLPDTGPATDPDRSRFSTFRCRRVNVQVSANGTPATTVDIDGGQDLLDTLTARLTAANDLVS